MEYIEAKSILSPYQEQNGWFGVHYNMNLYRGCSHGCMYCDSRSECYGIEEFERVRAKADALAILARELASKKRKGIVHTGSMSDPYNPMEQTQNLTRGALSLLAKNDFGVVLATKSDLVVRDVDLFLEIDRHSPVAVNITVTTADDRLSRQIEPHVCESSRRFAAIKKLREKGVVAGVLLMPVLPFIEDTPENIQEIVKQAADAGANYIFAGPKNSFGVTMRDRQREYFLAKAEELFPGMRRRYQNAFGLEYSCISPFSPVLWQEFVTACERYHIEYKMENIIKLIRKKHEQPQFRLF